ncbi:MAG: diguanylate cyclase [Desulfosarcina sp.]|nr:diguanylate cyclase [Desulfosarcina sp.]MBC2744257.1 diguanylate cyclase [Desulfosarcina sp.]MBC2767166.1 diguanylate cyclase [Desulfosarcina sp.]
MTLCRIDVTFQGTLPNVKNDVLRQLGAALAGCIRGGDTLSRIDAQQFVLLITGSTDGEHEALLQRIQSAADGIRSDTGDKTFSIHLSSTTVPLESATDGG